MSGVPDMASMKGRLLLTSVGYREGLVELAARDSHLASVIAKWGEPPFWTHDRGFPGLVLSILAQQVSLESAEAAYNKLASAIGHVEPAGFLALDDEHLKGIGFSRQKAAYVRGLARALENGDLDLDEIESWDDNRIRARLVEIKGIGRWTADAYLLFSLRRADAWPSGDLALVKSIQEVKGLDNPLSFEDADRMALDWSPWRAVAARILWHSYLCERGRG